MPTFDRKKFFDGFRKRIDPTIEQEQVEGLNFLLGQMESDPFWKHIPQIAYALATTYHETAGSFQPVEEGYYLGSATRVKRFQKTLRYYPYYGRGYVQLTWKKNYDKAGNILGLDLVNKPELALKPEGAYQTMTYGMHQGWFTGKKLDDYIKNGKKDYTNARKIINGLDKAGLIAGYARSFEQILNESATNSTATPAVSQITERTTATDDSTVTAGQAAVDTSSNIPVPLVPVPTVVEPQPVIQVESVTAETESKIDTTLNKWSSRWAAIPAAGLTFLASVWSFLTSSPAMITITLIVTSGAIVGSYFLLRMILNSRDKARQDKLQDDREARAHEIMLLTLKAAADPAMNTVRVVSPPSTEMKNSDNPANAEVNQ